MACWLALLLLGSPPPSYRGRKGVVALGLKVPGQDARLSFLGGVGRRHLEKSSGFVRHSYLSVGCEYLTSPGRLIFLNFADKTYKPSSKKQQSSIWKLNSSKNKIGHMGNIAFHTFHSEGPLGNHRFD